MAPSTQQHSGEPRADDARALIAAWTDFWAEAGVDSAFADDPRDWLAEAASEDAAANAGNAVKDAVRSASRVATRPVPRIGGETDGWPVSLDDFAAWWLTEPSLDSGNAPRTPPAGKPGAPVMLLIAEPEREDANAPGGARLLSGPQGRLVDAMLAAMGLTRDDAYLASALPRPTPAADWQALGEAGMGAVVRHHVALARPDLLAVFGSDLVRLLAPDSFDPASGTGMLTLKDLQIPLIAGYPLDGLARRPRAKALWWHRWLALSQPS